jgi:hypothetical protein
MVSETSFFVGEVLVTDPCSCKLSRVTENIRACEVAKDLIPSWVSEADLLERIVESADRTGVRTLPGAGAAEWYIMAFVDNRGTEPVAFLEER